MNGIGMGTSEKDLEQDINQYALKLQKSLGKGHFTLEDVLKDFEKTEGVLAFKNEGIICLEGDFDPLELIFLGRILQAEYNDTSV